MSEEDSKPAEPISGDKDDASPTKDDVSVTREDLEAPRPGPDQDFEVQDELQEAFVARQLPTVLGADGLPDMSVEAHDEGVPPPFTYDTVVCVADDRTYVELWDDEVDHGDEGWEALEDLNGVEWDPRPRFTPDGGERSRREFKRSEVVTRFGCRVVIVGERGKHRECVPVRPIRPQCEHYRRQVFATSRTVPGAYGHRDVHPNCMARRSVGGAYLCLTNEAVYACEYREPRDLRSENMQADADRARLDAMAHRLLVPAFGVAGEERQLTADEDPWTFERVWNIRKKTTKP